MQKEIRNDCTCGSQEHRRITSRRVGPAPVQSADDADKRARKKDRACDIQVQINSAGRRVIESPEHEEKTDEKICHSVDEDLFTRAKRSLSQSLSNGKDHVLRDHGAPPQQVRTVY